MSAPITRTPFSGRCPPPLEAVAPRLWAYEVRNSVLMGLRRKRITHADAQEFFESIKGLPIRLADPVSYDGVFGLADRHGLTVYDAAYLDLALRRVYRLPVWITLSAKRPATPVWPCSSHNPWLCRLRRLSRSPSRSGFITPPALAGDSAVDYQAAGEVLLAAYAKVRDLAFAISQVCE